jgi:S1-C subfamily serine protease
MEQTIVPHAIGAKPGEISPLRQVLLESMEVTHMATENQANPLVALSDAMAEAVSKAGMQVVTVDARRRLPASGITYAADLVLTANHVVERDEDIRIALPNGDQLTAQIAGRDPGTDLAVLRLDKKVLSPAEPAPKAARVGQLALALGRPDSEGIQASLGVVSAIGGPVRTRRGNLLENYLRTDTIPYPGFSGGPLIDTSAKVLGVNTSGLAPGVPLTIPSALAWSVAESLAQHGQVRRGYLGIRSQPVPIPEAGKQNLGREQDNGLLLVGVEPGSPSESAGLMVGDILVGLAGEAISDPDQLLSRLVGKIVGEPTPVEVLRGGKLMTITVKIGQRP